jgi:cell division protein FtsN
MIDPASDLDEELGVTKEINRGTKRAEFMRRIYIVILILLLVGGGFLLSFVIGKRVLIPIKALPSIYVSSPAPEKAEPEESAKAEDEALVEVPAEKPAETAKEVKPAEPEPMSKAAPVSSKYFKVQAGVFNDEANAVKFADELKAKGFPTFIKSLPDKRFRVQVGAYEKRQFAEKLVEDLKKTGFSAIIIDD